MDLRERSEQHGLRHPWEVVRARFFGNRIVKSIGNQPVSILDLGSGDCWFAEQLLPRLPSGSTITCCDINFTELDLSTPTAMGVTKMRDLPEGRFDIVVLLDVIEHVENDMDFLQANVQPKLVEGGMVLVSVPAHPSLYSEHDEFLGHYRRYTRRQLLTTTNTMFTHHENGYLFVSLALVRFLQRLLPKKGLSHQQGVGSWTSGKSLTRTVTILLSIDALVSVALRRLRIQLPGLTVWVSSTGKVIKSQ